MKISGVLLLGGYWSLLAVGSLFVIADDDEWLDPYNMLNYDASSKTMKNSDQASSYSNVPTKRRAFNPDVSQGEQCPDNTQCISRLDMLQRELEEHKRGVIFSSQQPTCNPVFKRFLTKLLKEIEKLGLPTDVNIDMHYDAEVKLSKRMVAEIRKLLNDDGTWRTGALDAALDQILINFKLHDYEAWKWQFEDTFGVELETVIKVSFCILIITLIICTEMWSTVSWFVQFKRMFAICFIISIVWNWFYLYKIAFAEHQANIIKMENVNEKCTGVKKIDWKDNLKEWFRTTWTLQGDPCKKYYEVLMVNPILLVPPTKAIAITFTTFITDPLKHIGQGISEFLIALLKDLPVTLQIPVLITIVLCILVFVYGTAQAAIQHAVLRPLRSGRRDHPPPAVQHPPRPPLREEEEEDRQWAGGDADRVVQPRPHPFQDGNGINRVRNQADRLVEVQQRRNTRPNLKRQRVYVETLRNANDLCSGDETDNQQVDGAEETCQREENELLTSDVAKEENEASTGAKVEPELSKPAPKEPSAKSDDANSKASGGEARGFNSDPSKRCSGTQSCPVTKNQLDEATNVVGAFSKEENVETLRTLLQEIGQ